MIKNIKVWDKNDNYITIDINEDLSKMDKISVLNYSRKLVATKCKNVYSYSIYSTLCDSLGL